MDTAPSEVVPFRQGNGVCQLRDAGEASCYRFRTIIVDSNAISNATLMLLLPPRYLMSAMAHCRISSRLIDAHL